MGKRTFFKTEKVRDLLPQHSLIVNVVSFLLFLAFMPYLVVLGASPGSVLRDHFHQDSGNHHGTMDDRGLAACRINPLTILLPFVTRYFIMY